MNFYNNGYQNIAQKIGTIRLKEKVVKRDDSFENIAWWQKVEVAPQTVDLVRRGNTIYFAFAGTIVECALGTYTDQIGTEAKVNHNWWAFELHHLLRRPEFEIQLAPEYAAEHLNQPDRPAGEQ